MTDRVKEQISAFMDGELDDREVDLLLRRFEKDEALSETWESYHRVGDSLMGNSGAVSSLRTVDAGFSSAIMAQLESESVAAVKHPRFVGVRKHMLGLATVATVVLGSMVFLEFQATEPGVTDYQPMAAVTQAGETVAVVDPQESQAAIADVEVYQSPITAGITRATLGGTPPRRVDAAFDGEWIRSDEQNQTQFDDYLSYHNEAAASTQSAGILPYTAIRVTDRQSVDQTH